MKTIKYQKLNKRKSWIGTLAAVTLEQSFRFHEGNIIEVITDAAGYEYPEDKKGGIITFSTTVNALELSDFINTIKQFYIVWEKRFPYASLTDKDVDCRVSWIIGRFFKGNYKNYTYDSNSLSLEIVGIDNKELISISEDLCRKFKQEAVLLKLYINNSVFLINP